MGGVRQRGNALAYKYTSFCVKYRAWAAGLKRSMRQIHIAGEKLFVDYAGQTVPIIDAATGEIRRAQIFVAVLGASNYTYAGATWSQTTADWIGAHVARSSSSAACRALIVPDQTRARDRAPRPLRARAQPHLRGVRRATTACAVLPARPAHPRDKPKVESRRAGRRALDPGAAAQPALLQPGRAQRGDRASCWSI